MTAPLRDLDRLLDDIESPDLLSIDDKCDVAFGPLDAAGQAALDRLLVGIADYGMPRGGEHRG